MPRYAAFLRGVMPTNCRMADLKRSFEAAGFTDVKTVLGSGNVVFEATRASNEALQRRAEAAMQEHMGRVFAPFVRPIDTLLELLASDPYRRAHLDPEAKRIVTFLHAPPARKPRLPIEAHGATIAAMSDCEVFSAYVRAEGPEFMKLIERTFGKDQTTRTWQTLEKVSR